MKKSNKVKYVVGTPVCLLILGLIFFFVKRTLMVPTNQVAPKEIVLPEKDNLVFFALGDTGTGEADQFMVAAAMEQRCQELKGLDGILLLGDNIYKTGAESQFDPQWHEKVEKPYGSSCLNSVNMYPVLGNHDYKGGHPGAQIEYSQINPRWKMPHRFFSVKYGSLLKLVAIDTAFPDFCFLPGSCSIDFLRSQIAEPDVQWKMALTHHPLASASELGFSHSGGFLGAFLKLFACEDLDAWLSGHAHHLEHRKISSCRADLFVSGGGGADLYDYFQQEESQFAKKAHGFLEIHVNQQQMHFQFFDKYGEKLYTFTRHKE